MQCNATLCWAKQCNVLYVLLCILVVILSVCSTQLSCVLSLVTIVICSVCSTCDMHHTPVGRPHTFAYLHICWPKYPRTGATYIWVAPHVLGHLAVHTYRYLGPYLHQHIWYSSSWSTVYLNGSLAHLGIWRQNILPGGALLCTWVPYLGSTIRAGRKSPSLGNSSWADSQDSFLCIAPDITPSVSYKIKSNTLKTLIYDVGPSRKIHNFTLVRLVDLVAVWL